MKYYKIMRVKCEYMLHLCLHGTNSNNNKETRPVVRVLLNFNLSSFSFRFSKKNCCKGVFFVKSCNIYNCIVMS